MILVCRAEAPADASRGIAFGRDGAVAHRCCDDQRGDRKAINELEFWRAGHGETLFLYGEVEFGESFEFSEIVSNWESMLGLRQGLC